MTVKPIPPPPRPQLQDNAGQPLSLEEITARLSQWSLQFDTWADGVHRALLNLRNVANAAVILDGDGNNVLSGDLCHTGSQIGVFGADKVAKQTVTGVRDSNTALASLITAIENFGWITDSTTAT